MGTLREDIDNQSDWIVKAFAEDKLKLDYSLKSLIAVDQFFLRHTSDGKAKSGGRLAKNLGDIIFSIGAYVGNTIIRNVPGAIWETDDDAPDGEINVAVKFPDGTVIWPMQRVMKRFKNGIEDSVYVYGYEITKDFTKEEFDPGYWKSIKESKSWWKFW